MSFLLPPSDDDPIVALATPWGESALALIRATGQGCIQRAARLVRGREPLDQAASRMLVHGRLADPRSGETLDEVLVWVQHAPGGYTGQDSVEVSCHGGIAVVQSLLDLFLRNGFRAALPGEFTLRAFRSGRMDLTRAEAVNELIRARSDRGRAHALARLGGALEARVEDMVRSLLSFQAAIELGLDYPEDEGDNAIVDPAALRAIRGRVDGLLSTYAAGRMIQAGARVAITGRSNAGKSTLFNLLLRQDRSIVSPVPGTTRDYIEAELTLQGYPLRLYDTAGLREMDDEVEREGMRRTDTVVSGADLALYLVDATVGETQGDRDYLAGREEERLLRVWTKTDLASSACPPGYVPCSALTGDGVEALHAEIARRLYGGLGTLVPGEVIESERQKRYLQAASGALERAAAALERGLTQDLVAVDVREALEALGAITGRITTQDILTEVFSRFCVGK